MKILQRGFITKLVLSIIILLLIVGFGIYAYIKHASIIVVSRPNPPITSTSSTPSLITASSTTPDISYLNKISGPVGTLITVTGSGFLDTNTVLFGGGPIDNVMSSNATTLSFMVPTSVGPDCKEGMACPLFERLITPGASSISVRNTDGTSNTLPFTVTSN